MRTSFRAALTDWKCVVQKSGCSTMIEAPCFNEAYNMCACYAGNARHVRNGTSQADKTKQDQASCSKWKDAGCFLAKQQPLPYIFLHKSPHEPFICEMCRGGTMNRHQPIQQNI